VDTAGVSAQVGTEIDAAARAGRDRKGDDEDGSDADSDAEEERRAERAGSRWPSREPWLRLGSSNICLVITGQAAASRSAAGLQTLCQVAQPCS
jgi:hypothetical protein